MSCLEIKLKDRAVIRSMGANLDLQLASGVWGAVCGTEPLACGV